MSPTNRAIIVTKIGIRSKSINNNNNSNKDETEEIDGDDISCQSLKVTIGAVGRVTPVYTSTVRV